MVDEGSSNSAVNLVGFFLEFAEKLLASARSHVASEGMPKRIEHPFLFRAPEFTGPAASGSTISFRGIEKPDFRGLLLFNRERWAKAEAERCAQEHFAHGVRRERQVLDENWQLVAFPTFGHLGNQLGSQLTYEVYYAIADLCERLQTLRPTGEQLLEAYERLTEEWTCPTVMWHLGAPLLNFKTEKCPVRIGKSLELALLSHDEKTSLWNQNAGFGPFGEPQVMDRGDLARAQFVFWGSSTTGRDAGFGPEFRDEVARVVTALRLFGSGDMGIPAVLGSSTGLFEKFASQYVFDGRARNSGRMYELRAADWETFTKVYDALGVIDDKMSIPLRRFNQAYGRQSGEDAIIDLTIALESCLLPNTRDELQYRLSMRGAALLASLRNPVETQGLLKTIYGIRSEIVHNGRRLSENGVRKKIESLGPIVAKDFLHACEDVVRDVLRESVVRLATGSSPAGLCQELDERILLGLTAAGRASSTKW